MTLPARWPGPPQSRLASAQQLLRVSSAPIIAPSFALASPDPLRIRLVALDIIARDHQLEGILDPQLPERDPGGPAPLPGDFRERAGILNLATSAQNRG